MAVETILVYFNATRDLCITYERDSGLSLTVFADPDYASQATDRRSISGIEVMLGGAAVCSIGHTQHKVMFLTTEAEHVAMAEGVKDKSFVRSALSFV